MKKLKDEELKKVNGGSAVCGGAIYNTDTSDVTIKHCESINSESDKPSSGGFVGGICGDNPTSFKLQNVYNDTKPSTTAGIGGGSAID